MLRSSKSKLVLIAANCPVLRKSEIEYHAMLAKTTVRGGGRGSRAADGRASSPTRHLPFPRPARPLHPQVHNFAGSNVELGTSCGKLFRCGILSIQDAGDSDILRVLSAQ